MTRTNRDYLKDILQELDDVIAFTIEGEAVFMQDVKTQKAVIRSYEVVGEVCKRFAPAFRVMHTEIDWRTLMSFRDFLAHNYEFIRLRYVWDAVKDVHDLRQMFQSVLDELPPDEDTGND